MLIEYKWFYFYSQLFAFWCFSYPLTTLIFTLFINVEIISFGKSSSHTQISFKLFFSCLFDSITSMSICIFEESMQSALLAQAEPNNHRFSILYLIPLVNFISIKKSSNRQQLKTSEVKCDPCSKRSVNCCCLIKWSAIVKDVLALKIAMKTYWYTLSSHGLSGSLSRSCLKVIDSMSSGTFSPRNILKWVQHFPLKQLMLDITRLSKCGILSFVILRNIFKWYFFEQSICSELLYPKSTVSFINLLIEFFQTRYLSLRKSAIDFLSSFSCDFKVSLNSCFFISVSSTKQSFL